MQAPSDETPSESNAGAAFPRTLWTMVLTAAHGQEEQSRKAMRRLCEVYFEPVRRWLLRTYHPPEMAEELAQAFMEHLLEANRLKNFEKRVPKFRSSLLECLKRFVRGEWRKKQAAKRGGEAEHVDLDEAAVGFTPDLERQLDLDFAVAVHHRALRALELKEYAGKPDRFRALSRFVLRQEGPSYAEIARELQIEPNCVKKLVHDLRHHFFEAFRREVGDTVEPSAQDEETRYLLELLARDPDAWDSSHGATKTS